MPPNTVSVHITSAELANKSRGLGDPIVPYNHIVIDVLLNYLKTSLRIMDESGRSSFSLEDLRSQGSEVAKAITTGLQDVKTWYDAKGEENLTKFNAFLGK
jgi:hypothetical protein